MDIETARSYIQKAQPEFNKWQSEVKVGQRYYGNDDDINKHGTAIIDAVNGYLKEIGQNPLRSADNRIATNYHELLVVQKTAYGFTYPPIFTIGDDDKLSQKISEMLGDNYQGNMMQLATNASNSGRAWLQYWIDPEGNFQTAPLDADDCVSFTDPRDITRTPIALVRRYTLTNQDGENELHYEVWDKKEAVFINGETMDEEEVLIGETPVSRMAHNFGEIPFIEFDNNPLKNSDLKKNKGLIDAIDRVVSGFINDLDDIQEVLLIFRDYDGDTETSISVPMRDEKGNILYDDDGEMLTKEVTKPINLLQQLKAQKWATVNETGGIDKLSIDIPHEARDVALKMLQKQIFISGMGVDPNPEHTGQATGAYVDHLYYLLELKMGVMEAMFRPALNKLVRAMLKHIKQGENLKIEQTWTRNKPKIDNEIVERLNSTPSTVMSDYTKRRKHPDIDDPEVEDKRVEKEQAELRENTFDTFQQSLQGEESEG